MLASPYSTLDWISQSRRARGEEKHCLCALRDSARVCFHHWSEPPCGQRRLDGSRHHPADV